MTNMPTNNWTSSIPPSLESMKAIAEKMAAARREDDRKVFRFDGTLAEFKAAIEKDNFEVAGGVLYPMTVEEKPPAYMDRANMPVGYSSGLEVHQIAGSIWVGTEKAIRTLRESMEGGPALATPLVMNPYRRCDICGATEDLMYMPGRSVSKSTNPDRTPLRCRRCMDTAKARRTGPADGR